MYRFKITNSYQSKSIKNFIDQGNLFVISTGRPTNSILNELETYKILYNYLTCYEGLVSLDSKKTIIYAKYLDDELIYVIKNIFKTGKIIDNIITYDEYGNISNTNIIRLKFIVKKIN